MYYYRLKAKLIALYVAQAIIKYFVKPVVKATAASIVATLRLPHTIVTAVKEAKESAELDRQMEEALIDPTFLDRALKND